jgi:hypothetical protein
MRTVGTFQSATETRSQQMVYTTNAAPLRWFETVNPAAVPVNTGEGLLMQAYTLSLANFCR